VELGGEVSGSQIEQLVDELILLANIIVPVDKRPESSLPSSRNIRRLSRSTRRKRRLVKVLPNQNNLLSSGCRESEPPVRIHLAPLGRLEESALRVSSASGRNGPPDSFAPAKPIPVSHPRDARTTAVSSPTYARP
jgi:hypothetical protein